MIDIYYNVKINQDKIDSSELGYMFRQTTCSKIFCGRLVNEENGRFFFELNGSNALVIIPYSWIEWMAPSKILWEKRNG